MMDSMAKASESGPHVTLEVRVWWSDDGELLITSDDRDLGPKGLVLKVNRYTPAWSQLQQLLATMAKPHGPIPSMKRAPRKSTAYSIDDLRRVHPKSHTPWTPEEEQLLVERVEQGATIEALVAEFGRNPNGITARMGRLGIAAAQHSDEDTNDNHK